MKSIILYSDSSTTTSVQFFESGQVLICNEELAGTYLLRVPKEEKQDFFYILFEAWIYNKKTYFLGFITRRFGLKLPENLTDDKINDNMILCLKKLFLNRLEDPFEEIKSFLFKKEIKFGSEYWTSR
tara:strand:- start:1297 stop:1677 length:381 start_codon:yes stop_codon:yes gene_type:complete